MRGKLALLCANTIITFDLSHTYYYGCKEIQQIASSLWMAAIAEW